MLKWGSSWSKFKHFITTFFSLYLSADIDLTSVAVAYYIIVAVFPILMLMASLLPYFQIDVQQILLLLKRVFPDQLYPQVFSLVLTVLTQPSSSWLGISIITTFWTISRSMSALQKAVNKAYGVTEHRNFILSHIIGIFLGIGLQLIITLSVLMIAFGNTVLQQLHRWIEFDNSSLIQTGPIVYISLFLALVMLYFFLPNVRIKKIQYVFPGAIFVLVVMGTVGHLFSIYIESYAARLMDFRFVTSVIILVLMLWFVFMANILITGAVLNATVQSMFVDEFDSRSSDIGSVLNRIKARFRGIDERANCESQAKSSEE